MKSRRSESRTRAERRDRERRDREQAAKEVIEAIGEPDAAALANAARPLSGSPRGCVVLPRT
jgi:hypothetical protein